ncbi:DNA adenine methylase [Aquabacterium sp. OR-4]|uniref:DNA adenine methylase n=1 Tax=Aquabacterium sp. OR-4 TaxID=2978127 RepID=UPI0021B3C5F2|nr:DNA adenine methylase [Aquabacterium sp. OR-4]MDT7838207.1 DNA adenine methylase [Aquabacterium sp. OR-4]
MATPMIPWIGGKRRLADKILPLLADHEHSCYVEPFCGAAALFFLRERRTKVEVLNDINGDLVNLYRVVQHHLEEFVRQFKWALSSRQVYEWAQMTSPETLTDIQRAARFFLLQKLGFGGKVEGRSFGTATTTPARLNLLRIEEDLSQVHLRLNGVFIEHQPWDVCIERYDRAHTMFFLDPPYWAVEGYGVPFGIEQYERMAALMRSIKGRAVVTVNDVPEMRRVFDGLAMTKTAITYSVAADPGKRKPTGELIIRSWR